ncbi:MAG: ATP-binding protein [Bacteroidales bacterium]
MKQAIICVDDEDIILEALKDQLSTFLGSGFEVETALDADEAMEIFQELSEQGVPVPVVISDYLMPGMLGDEFLIRMHQVNPDALKILLTGHANVEGVVNAINKANLYRFIPKPWDSEDLILTVKEALRSFLMEVEIRNKNRELESMNQNLEKLVDERTAELAEANATKDKFFSIIAHDLKGAFNSLMGLSDFLIADFANLPDSERMEILSHIKAVSDSSYKLLQNLLDWARVQTGKIPFAPAMVDLSMAVENELTFFCGQASQKQIVLKKVFPDATVQAYADLNMLSTILRNLISNALKFTYPGGQVTITVADAGDFAEISVSDTGIGIAPENLQRLFKVSEHVKSYGTNREEGTGLGLILCREFVQKHGGAISVESSPKGSRFYFTLPKQPAK